MGDGAGARKGAGTTARVGAGKRARTGEKEVRTVSAAADNVHTETVSGHHGTQSNFGCFFGFRSRSRSGERYR